MFRFDFPEKKCCLTCQYFTGRRSLNIQGRLVRINYENERAGCKLSKYTSCTVHTTPNSRNPCMYKRWIDLP